MNIKMSDEEINEEYVPKVYTLRFGVILTENKTCRFIIAVQDNLAEPIVILREMDEYVEIIEDPDTGETTEENLFPFPVYSLFEHALTLTQAVEILDELEANNRRKANTLLKRYFDGSKPKAEYWDDVDDAISDDWYDAWKEMEGIVASRRDHPGYYEADVEEDLDCL